MSKEIIGVIGSGAMGTGIAQVAAMAGHKVHVYDANPVAVKYAADNLKKTLLKLVEKEKISAEKSAEILASIIFQSSLSQMAECDLVIEAIVEDLAIKCQVFAELENVVSAECILASNTSSLSIASIAASCRKGERVLGVHFFNPAPLMPLVEIIPALQTVEAIVERSKKIIDSWGKVTVICKDTPGFIVNRVARTFYSEAIRVMEEGIADMATIDWAMREIGGFKMGPFELMDFIGHDVNYRVTETVWEQFFFDPRFKPSLSQKRLYEAKRFGRKSGIGFYNYAEGTTLPEPLKDKVLGEQVFLRIISMLINEAADTLYLKIASKEDIDLAMTKGVNYPKGLLKWADELGLKKILLTLEGLYTEYEEDRYRACVLLKKMVRDDKRFYQ